MCGTSREHLMFAGDVYRMHIPAVLNVFSDAMTKHLFVCHCLHSFLMTKSLYHCMLLVYIVGRRDPTST
jgi:hypothetical protein